MVDNTTKVVSVTKKGQATIPQELRRKYKVGDKVLVMETNEGILLKPLPRPEDEYGSLRDLFGGVTARELLDEARAHEGAKERLRERGGK